MKPNSKVTKAVITAAGVGTRLLPYTKSVHNAMTTVLNYPSIHYVVKECADSGIKDIIIVVKHPDTALEGYFDNNFELEAFLEKVGKTEQLEEVRKIKEFGNITFVRQTEDLPYGNGSPVLAAKPFLGNENFAVLFSDVLTVSDPPTTFQLVEKFEKSECSGVISAFEMKKEEMPKHGMIVLDEGSNDRMEQIIEKPDISEVVSTLSSRGRYVFSNKIFNYLKPENTGKNGELWLVDAISAMNKDSAVLVQKIEGKCYTIGDPLNFIKTNIDFALARGDIKEQVEEYLKAKI